MKKNKLIIVIVIALLVSLILAIIFVLKTNKKTYTYYLCTKQFDKQEKLSSGVEQELYFDKDNKITKIDTKVVYKIEIDEIYEATVKSIKDKTGFKDTYKKNKEVSYKLEENKDLIGKDAEKVIKDIYGKNIYKLKKEDKSSFFML